MNCQSFSSCLKAFLTGNDLLDTGFRTGYFSGVLVAIILLFLISFLYWLFFKRIRYAKGVSGSTEKGPYFVSSRAVSDLVVAVSRDVRELEIRKVLLLKDKKGCRISVTANYKPSSQAVPLPAAVASLQDRITSSLNETFGISEICGIFIRVDHAKADKNVF